jgi:hypothetical protein
MNTISVELSAPNDNGVRKAIIKIDGRELLEVVREIEAPIAAATGEPDLAGKYDYLNAIDIVYPSRQLLGQPVRALLDYGAKVSILECDCGCEGCWPLLVRAEANEKTVIWREFEQPHRKEWRYPDQLRLVFDRDQLEAALKIEE